MAKNRFLRPSIQKLEPDAFHWVSKDKDGQLTRIRVADMEAMHLRRWILYFRRKYIDEGFSGSTAELDMVIQRGIVTAHAIYRQAHLCGVLHGLTLSPPPVIVTAPPPLRTIAVLASPVVASLPQASVTTTEIPEGLGHRRIELEDEHE